jgi:hypothetical protein
LASLAGPFQKASAQIRLRSNNSTRVGLGSLALPKPQGFGGIGVRKDAETSISNSLQNPK